MGVNIDNTLNKTIINAVDTHLNNCPDEIQTLKDDVDFNAIKYVI